MYDLVIKNARIIDGTGAPWFRADVAVKDGKIAAMGKITGEAKEVVDAKDRYLAPGFIDIHSHSDDDVLSKGGVFSAPECESRILQGVTTDISGNCGSSVAPSAAYPRMRDYFAVLEELKPSCNMGMLVGHGNVRAEAMGYDNRKPTEEELETMRRLVREAMEDGCFGISSGLIYPPSSYADTDELIEVAKAAAPYGGYYATHMRSESLRLIEATKEALQIAYEADVPLQISHHKCTRSEFWQVRVLTTTAMIERARNEGLEVLCDQYPYRASATTLSVNFNDWVFEGGTEAMLQRLRDPETRARIKAELEADWKGRWQNLVVSYTLCEKDVWMSGKSLPEIAEKIGKDCADALIDIVLDAEDKVGELAFGMCEEDIEYIMKKPYVMTGSDGGAMNLSVGGKPHPRNFGTFVRVLSHYCRDRKLFPIETAVHKMTGLPASRLKLEGRGILKTGMWADLVLFDLETLKDDPSYLDPQQPCSGILRVYVNGVLTALDGKHTGARAGVVVRRGEG